MNTIRFIFLLLICTNTSTIAQQPVTMDAASLINSITPLPPSLEEFHSLFTKTTRFGETFRLAELTDPPYLHFKHLVRTLHDSTIKVIMQRARRTDMVDTVQYEDERWKLALRPLLGPSVKSRIATVDPAVRSTVGQIFDMQNVFDWVAYSREDEDLKKIYRQKIAALSSKPKAMVQQQELLYERQQQLWDGRLKKYTAALIRLQQLLESISYGNNLHGGDGKLVRMILADVQTRALEAHEKLIWIEMQIATTAELTFFDKRVANMIEQ